MELYIIDSYTKLIVHDLPYRKVLCHRHWIWVHPCQHSVPGQTLWMDSDQVGSYGNNKIFQWAGNIWRKCWWCDCPSPVHQLHEQHGWDQRPESTQPSTLLPWLGCGGGQQGGASRLHGCIFLRAMIALATTKPLWDFHKFRRVYITFNLFFLKALNICDRQWFSTKHNHESWILLPNTLQSESLSVLPVTTCFAIFNKIFKNNMWIIFSLIASGHSVQPKGNKEWSIQQTDN